MTVAEFVYITDDELALLTDDERAAYARYCQAVIDDWRTTARPDQLPPDQPWEIVYYRGGRGSGKTWTGGNVLAEDIRANDAGEWAVVAPTFGDARDVCIESSESGLIKALGGRVVGGRLVEHGDVAGWNRSNGELFLANGGIVYADGADDGALRIQGKNLRGAWCDEIGLWRRWETAWDESIGYAVRLDPAHIIATGTPKRNMPARALVKRLLEDPNVVSRRLLTADNHLHLNPKRLARMMQQAGTLLGRQELEGDLIDDTSGTLWSYAQIEADRFTGEFAIGQLVRICTAIDPAVTSGEDSDETGMIVGGRTNGVCPMCGPTELPHALIVADRSGRFTPGQMASRAIGCHDEFLGDAILAEVNNGGDYIEAALRSVDPSVAYRAVHASRGKRIRAEPVAALYEQHRVHHVGALPELEAQLCEWVPDTGASPDRLDALVWLLTDLLLVDEKETGDAWAYV